MKKTFTTLLEQYLLLDCLLTTS